MKRVRSDGWGVVDRVLLLFLVERAVGVDLISSFEHALYGCAVFTIGLGPWFYHGVWPY